MAGGQIGCNYQTGIIVLGVEGEGWWSGFRSGYHFQDAVTNYEYTTANQWDFDVAVRAGFTWDHALIYAKVGAAGGSFSYGFTSAATGVVASGSGLSPGLLLGVGGEYALTPVWSVKLEYNFIDYVAQIINFSTSTIPFGESQSARKQIVKLGLNYKFYCGAVSC